MFALVCHLDHTPNADLAATTHCQTVAKTLVDAMKTALSVQAKDLLQPTLDEIEEELSLMRQQTQADHPSTTTRSARTSTHNTFTYSTESGGSDDEASAPMPLLVVLTSGHSLKEICLDDDEYTLEDLKKVCPTLLVDLNDSEAVMLEEGCAADKPHLAVECSTKASLARNLARFLTETVLSHEMKSSWSVLFQQFASWFATHSLSRPTSAKKPNNATPPRQLDSAATEEAAKAVLQPRPPSTSTPKSTKSVVSSTKTPKKTPSAKKTGDGVSPGAFSTTTATDSAATPTYSDFSMTNTSMNDTLNSMASPAKPSAEDTQDKKQEKKPQQQQQKKTEKNKAPTPPATASATTRRGSAGRHQPIPTASGSTAKASASGALVPSTTEGTATMVKGVPYCAANVVCWVPVEEREKTAQTPRPASTTTTTTRPSSIQQVRRPSSVMKAPNMSAMKARYRCSHCDASADKVSLLVCMQCRGSYAVCGPCYHVPENRHAHEMFKRVDPGAVPTSQQQQHSGGVPRHAHVYTAGGTYHRGCAHKECSGGEKTAAMLFDSYLTFLRQQIMEAAGDNAAPVLPPGQSVDVPPSLSEFLLQTYGAYTQGAFRTNRAVRLACADERCVSLVEAYLRSMPRYFGNVVVNPQKLTVDANFVDVFQAVRAMSEMESEWVRCAYHEVSIVLHIPEDRLQKLSLSIFDVDVAPWEVDVVAKGYPEGIRHLEFHCAKHHVVRHATELLLRPRGKECVPYWPCATNNNKSKAAPLSVGRVRAAHGPPSVASSGHGKSRNVRQHMAKSILESNWNVSAAPNTAAEEYSWVKDAHLKKVAPKWMARFQDAAPNGHGGANSNNVNARDPYAKYQLHIHIQEAFLLSVRRMFQQLPGVAYDPFELPCVLCGTEIYHPAGRVASVGDPGTAQFRTFLFSLRMMCDDSTLAIASDAGAEEALALLGPQPRSDNNGNSAAIVRSGSGITFMMFLLACLLRTQDLATVKAMREAYDAWAAARVYSSDTGEGMWYDCEAVLNNFVPKDTTMRTLRRQTLSMACGRDYFPALLLATLPRLSQVHLHRGLPDCIYHYHTCPPPATPSSRQHT
eukprot:PhM_4_TR12665/c0_g1_i1/m.74508